MDWKKGNLRTWIFRVLVLIACVMMVVSFIMPWWVGRFSAGEEIKIYGWGLRHNLVTLASYVAGDVTPTWQIVLAWGYVGASIGLALGSTWLKRWWNSLALMIVGMGIISYAFVAINHVVANRLESFQIPLEGFTTVGGTVSLYASLQPGYTLAYIAGGIMVALALLKKLIVGKQQQ
jgi:hypothetical protein